MIFRGIHSNVEYDDESSEDKMSVAFSSGYRSLRYLGLDSSRTQIHQLFFAHSEIKNSTPWAEISQYSGAGDLAELESFFEIKHESRFD